MTPEECFEDFFELIVVWFFGVLEFVDELEVFLNLGGHAVDAFARRRCGWKQSFHRRRNVLHEFALLVGDVVFVRQFVFPRETTAKPLHEAIAENLHVAATRGRHSHVSVARCEFHGAIVSTLGILKG